MACGKSLEDKKNITKKPEMILNFCSTETKHRVK